MLIKSLLSCIYSLCLLQWGRLLRVFSSRARLRLGFCLGLVTCIWKSFKCLKSHLSGLTTHPAWRHVTGCQQEEVIERITEEESWRRTRRKQRQRGLGGKKEKKNCRMNEHAHFYSVIKTIPKTKKSEWEEKEEGRELVYVLFVFLNIGS